MKYCLSVLPEIDSMLRDARRILIASDFDGTLCPIANSPCEVHLATATLEIMRHIAAHPRFTLAVISGRSLSDIRSRVPLDILFAGNHGLEIAGGGLDFEHEEARQLRPVLAACCESLSTAMREWPGTWIEDKGLSATLHFRRVNERHHSALLFAARRCLASFGPQLALRVGNRALEIRPKVGWDKGSALNYIIENAGPFDACVCLGDDHTDERMFRAGPDHLNIRVGPLKRTAATHHLCEPADVTVLLTHIVDVCSSEVEAVVALKARPAVNWNMA